MTEHNFIKQLKGLKQITPDTSWLKSNREILLSQIANSGAKELSVWKRLVIDARSFTMAVSQPALVLGALLFFVSGASAFGYLAFNRAKPNESLYIARIISEKAKLSTVFNNEEKAKLEVQFAADHAEAITEVLAKAEAGAHTEANVAELNQSFDREINTVRTRISSMKQAPANTEVVTPALTPEEELILSAGSSKDGAGLQLALNNGTATETATTTASTTEPIKAEAKKADEILNEAKTLFDNKEYDSAIEKIKEVKELIK